MMSALLASLQTHADTEPTSTAILHGDVTVSYANLRDAVWRRADSLGRIGMARGERALLMMSNDIEDIVSLIALARLGASPLLVDRASSARERESVSARFAPAWIIDGRRAEASGSQRECSRGDSFLCLITSGVSGAPKLVAIDWEASASIAAAWSDEFGLQESDCVLCTTPICHSYGLCVGVIAPLCQGSTIALSSGPLTVRTIYQLVRAHSVSIIQSVPAYYRLLADVPDGNALNTVRLCISAGEALLGDLKGRWKSSFRSQLCNHYGASEVGQVAIDLEGTDNSVGRPIPSCSVEIRESSATKEEAGVVATGTEGHIWVRSLGRPFRYLDGNGNYLPASIGGWFDTGDLGTFDGAGRLTITGRVSARINVAGRKVDRGEIEQVIRSFPGVADCAVVGRQSREGEQVHAFVQAESLDQEDLFQFLRERLSGYKIPGRLVRVDSLPRTLSGKIRYGLLDEVGV